MEIFLLGDIGYDAGKIYNKTGKKSASDPL